jgi:hypothetical protein
MERRMLEKRAYHACEVLTALSGFHDDAHGK